LHCFNREIRAKSTSIPVLPEDQEHATKDKELCNDKEVEIANPEKLFPARVSNI